MKSDESEQSNTFCWCSTLTTLLPVFLGAGRPSIIDAYHLCPWYLIRCPLEIHFCIYEAVNQILLKITFNVSLQLAERSSMLDSDWLKDFWRSASPVLLVLVVPSLFPANQSYQGWQEREYPVFSFREGTVIPDKILGPWDINLAAEGRLWRQLSVGENLWQRKVKYCLFKPLL